MTKDLKMKCFIISIILLVNVSLFAQANGSKINWNLLEGKWECTKVIRIIKNKTEDISNEYKPYFCSYFPNLKFKDENPASNSILNGTYSINKTDKIINYNNLIQTVTYPNAKVPMKDNVGQGFKGRLKVIKLTQNQLELLEKESPLSEGPGDYTFYFKKIN